MVVDSSEWPGSSNGSDLIPGFEYMRGKGVSKGVNAYPVRKTGALGSSLTAFCRVFMNLMYSDLV